MSLTPPIPEKLFRHTWNQVNWVPHPKQREILLDRTRNKVVALGRRAGKSQLGGQRLVPEAFRTWMELQDLRERGQRREFWIVGPEYSDSEKEFRVAWDALQNLGFQFDRPGSYNNPESGEMAISMFDRKFIIHAKSAKHPERLVGEGLSGVILAEAAKLKPSIWYKYIRPTLADFQGWSLFTSTPEGRNWFYDQYMQGLDTRRPDWAAWRAPAWCNPHVYPGGVDEVFLDKAIEMRRRHKLDGLLNLYNMIRGDRTITFEPGGGANKVAKLLERNGVTINEEIWSMFLDMSQEKFNQEIAALFTEFVGRVFKDFDEELHVVAQEFQPGWATYAAVDYGFTNPFVWLLLQVDPLGERVHVLAEYYEVHKTTPEAAAEIAARGLAPRTIRKVFPDPAEPARSRELSSILNLRFHPGGSIPLQDRIEWIRRGLRITNGAPKLTFHPRCVNTIREHGMYKYRETAEQAGERGRSAPEDPEDKDNHSPEALGRFYSGLFGKPWVDKTGTRVSRVRTRRG